MNRVQAPKLAGCDKFLLQFVCGNSITFSRNLPEIPVSQPRLE